MQKCAMGRGLQRGLAVAALYAMLVCWLTWPLAAHLGTHLPGTFPGSEFDPLYSGWVMAWQSHALVSGAEWANANIYHPDPGALYYGPAALGALLYFAPIYLLTGNPTLALNLVLLGSIALTAAALHLVVYGWTSRHAAGLVAAITFLANRWLLFTFVPTVPHFSVLFYFPFIVALAAAPGLSARRTVLLASLMVLQCTTDLVYVTPAVLVPVLAVAAVKAARRSSRSDGLRLIGAAIAAAAAVLLIHAPYLRVASGNPQLAQQTNWRLDPAGSVLDFPGGLLALMSPFDVASGSLLFVAGVAAVVLWRGWRGSPGEALAARHAVLWIAVGLLISLPMRVSVLGSVWTLPHIVAAHAWIPFASALRLPERLRVAALMGFALLAGLALAELARHVEPAAPRTERPRWLAPTLALALCLAMLGQYRWAIGQPRSYGPALPPYKLQAPPAGTSPVLQALRQAGGPTLELPLPPGQPTAAGAHAPAMYRSIFHWQPLLNGYSSYWPADFLPRMRLAARLPDAAALAELQRQTGLTYVLVRADDRLAIDAKLGDQRAAWRAIARDGGRPDLTLVAADDELLLFRVGAPP